MPIADAGITRVAIPRAHRLKRVFGIDIETCPASGGAARIAPAVTVSPVVLHDANFVPEIVSE